MNPSTTAPAPAAVPVTPDVRPGGRTATPGAVVAVWLLLIALGALVADGPRLPALRQPARRRGRPTGDRGDIPGWVMIAIMSAAVVVVLIPFVGPVIERAFSNAVQSVSNTKSQGQ